MNCLIENEYIREIPPPQKKKIYSQINYLIKNDYIKGIFQKKIPIYSQINYHIKNDYIKGTFQKKEKNTYIFPNKLPN
jgi:DNA-binding transcriptional regulator YhcF (GntR family)